MGQSHPMKHVYDTIRAEKSRLDEAFREIYNPTDRLLFTSRDNLEYLKHKAKKHRDYNEANSIRLAIDARDSTGQFKSKPYAEHRAEDATSLKRVDNDLRIVESYITEHRPHPDLLNVLIRLGDIDAIRFIVNDVRIDVTDPKYETYASQLRSTEPQKTDSILWDLQVAIKRQIDTYTPIIELLRDAKAQREKLCKGKSDGEFAARVAAFEEEQKDFLRRNDSHKQSVYEFNQRQKAFEDYTKAFNADAANLEERQKELDAEKRAFAGEVSRFLTQQRAFQADQQAFEVHVSQFEAIQRDFEADKQAFMEHVARFEAEKEAFERERQQHDTWGWDTRQPSPPPSPSTPPSPPSPPPPANQDAEAEALLREFEAKIKAEKACGEELRLKLLDLYNHVSDENLRREIRRVRQLCSHVRPITNQRMNARRFMEEMGNASLDPATRDAAYDELDWLKYHPEMTGRTRKTIHKAQQDYKKR